jgi:hypothetical protein
MVHGPNFSYSSCAGFPANRASYSRSKRGRRASLCLVAVFWAVLLPAASVAETLRIATWHAPLSRKGPGLLLRDILKGTDEISEVIQVLQTVNPDVILLTKFDYDLDGVAARALSKAIWSQNSVDIFAPRPNGGRPSGVDLDNNGHSYEPRDAQGYGTFNGQRGLLVLSKIPIDTNLSRDWSHLLWAGMPNSRMLAADPGREVQRLSSSAHLAVPLATVPPLWILGFAATPPVFDGPEDRNGRRNADEITFWQQMLDGEHGPVPAPPFILAGLANLDPDRGEGLTESIRSLLNDPRLQDPLPKGPFGTATVDWEEPTPGRLRVSYVLPSENLDVIGSAVHWTDLGGTHKLVWVDLTWPPK